MALRVLCLGNDLLSDDSFGCLVAQQVRQMQLPVELFETFSCGFDLMDCLLGSTRLLVIDTCKTGTAAPGTLHLFCEEEFGTAPGPSPHYIGLFDVLRIAKTLDLPVPGEVSIIAVEPADCFTVGGAMDPAVHTAVFRVTDLIRIMADGRLSFRSLAANLARNAG